MYIPFIHDNLFIFCLTVHFDVVVMVIADLFVEYVNMATRPIVRDNSCCQQTTGATLLMYEGA